MSNYQAVVKKAQNGVADWVLYKNGSSQFIPATKVQSGLYPHLLFYKLKNQDQLKDEILINQQIQN